MTLTDAQIAADLELAAQATPGPWETQAVGLGHTDRIVYRTSPHDVWLLPWRASDPEYIVRACNALPDYAAEVLRLRKALLDIIKAHPAACDGMLRVIAREAMFDHYDPNAAEKIAEEGK